MRPEIQAKVDALLKARNDLTVARDTLSEAEAREAGLEEEFDVAVKERQAAERGLESAEEAADRARDVLDGSFNADDEPELDAEVDTLLERG